MDDKYLGATMDTPEQQAKDYKFEEIVASIDPVVWKEKRPDEWRKFPIFDQDGSGSCVAQTAAKLLGILYWLKNNTYVHFSATHIYQRRKNKPEGGMVGTDCMEILTKGVTLEELVPSQKMNDREMDTVEIPGYKNEVGEIFKTSNYVVLPVQDIETVASVIQKTGKGVMTWFFFKHDEWDEVPHINYPTLTADQASRHSVTAVDFGIYKGKKGIVIDDSWGPTNGTKGQRFITEDFFKTRNFFVAYPIDFKFTQGDETQKPHYFFSKTMRYSPNVYDEEVKMLQKCLQFDGCYPINSACTGYFGNVTKSAVVKYQQKNGLTADGIVGQNTRAKLNAQFQ